MLLTPSSLPMPSTLPVILPPADLIFRAPAPARRHAGVLDCPWTAEVADHPYHRPQPPVSRPWLAIRTWPVPRASAGRTGAAHLTGRTGRSAAATAPVPRP